MIDVINIDKLIQFIGVFFCGTVLVIIAIMLDLWDGVYTARLVGNKVHSHKLRVTVEKMSEYWRFIMIGFVADCLGYFVTWYNFPYITLIFCAGLVGVEIKSMFEHSKKRKTSSNELSTIIQSIVECVNEKDAKAIITKIVGDADDKEIESEKGKS